MNETISFPLYLPGISNKKNASSNLIAGNVGNKKTTLAVYNSNNGETERGFTKVFENKDFNSFLEIYHHFISENNLQKPDRISLGVAGPVINNICKISNSTWELDLENLKKETQVEQIYMLNDLEALAYSLNKVSNTDIETINTGTPSQKGNVAILAPGNGLGESGLFWDGAFLRPFATEGGHTEFSPRNDKEVSFYQFLHKIYSIVSWETVLTNDGMFNIYRFLRDIERHEGIKELNTSKRDNDFVDKVIEFATEKKSVICKKTLETYITYLAREANNLALKLKATGGLILTGEIPIKIKNFLNNDKFYKQFIISDRMEYLLKDTPIYILNNEFAVLQGAAIYGAYYEN